MHYLNPAFDPVILKVNANPDPADTGGVSATYPANKPGEGWQSHLCLKQTPSQQQALSPKLLICVSVECRRVEELISSDFFFFPRARATGAQFRKIQNLLSTAAGLHVEMCSVNMITLHILSPLPHVNYFCPFSLEPKHAHAASHLSSCMNVKG